MYIREGDTVSIISGDDKGRKGKVIRAIPQDGVIFVEGINMRKKHQKPRKEGEKGQVITKEGALNSAKAMIVCPKCGQASRIGFAKNKIGKEKSRTTRICKKCQQAF